MFIVNNIPNNKDLMSWLVKQKQIIVTESQTPNMSLIGLHTNHRFS